MRENRPSGSEGGEAQQTSLPYPYLPHVLRTRGRRNLLPLAERAFLHSRHLRRSPGGAAQNPLY
jgi:hypothetical protein